MAAAAGTPAAPVRTENAPAASPPAAMSLAEPAQAPAPAREQRRAAAPAPTPEEIQQAMARFSKHPGVLFQSSKGRYQYYVGGILNAEYDPQKSVLRVTPDQKMQSGPICEYLPDGKLKLSGKTGKAQLESIATCNELLHELTGYLK